VRVGDRVHEIEETARRFAFIRQTIKVDETHYSVKYRLYIEPDLFVQLYFNERSGTVGMTLVYHGQRLYGRDCETSNWHRHPVGEPAMHDASPEGAQPVSVEEFLTEVQAILIEAALI